MDNINLSRAVRLLGIKDNEFIYFKFWKMKDTSGLFNYAQLGKIKKKFDMQQFEVVKIKPHFTFYDGEFCGYDMTVKLHGISEDKVMYMIKECRMM